jgi:hypothetical protein
MAKLTRNQKSLLRSIIQSIEIDIQMVVNGQLSAADLQDATTKRLDYVKTGFEL